MRRYFRPTGGQGGTIASFFDGEATSEVGLKTGPKNDLWTVVEPNLTGVQRRVRAADRGFAECVRGAPGTPPQCKAVSRMMLAARANPRLAPIALAQIGRLQAATDKRLAQGYLSECAPVTF